MSDVRISDAPGHSNERSKSSRVIEFSIVVPAFNEAPNIPILLARLCETLERYGIFEIVVVDDGSGDNTLAVLRDAAAKDQRIRYLRLSRNFGHQAALRAGLAHSIGQAVISMDADMQHPVETIGTLIERWRAGYEIVTTTRQDPVSHSLFKRVTSKAYYRLLSILSETRFEPGSADFRLLDRKVVEAINKLPETELFFRGLIPWLGFQSTNVAYVPHNRVHGSSKYTLKKMTSLAVAGIVATSVTPLRLAILLALGVAGITVLYVVYALFVFFVAGGTIPGWASVIVCVNLIGALQLIVLGVIGEYLGRVLRETRQRPSYIVAESNVEHCGS